MSSFRFGRTSSVFVLVAILGFSSVLAAAQTKAASVSAPEKLSASFASIAKAVEPAVVSIDAKSKVADGTTKAETVPGDSEDILEFFRRQLPRRPVYAVGSGFILDAAGYILTNNHVIDNAARVSVTLESGEVFVAKVIGTDVETDLAVLKIEAGRPLPFLKFGDSDKAEVGDWVLAIGSPFGLSKTVTAGIISQVRRETPSASLFQQFIQTDAAINRGNSGGPLVNMDGEVIGVNSQIATSTGDYNGIGFALPARDSANVYKQIVDGGRVRRGYLGANLESVKAEFAKVYGMREAKGAIVTAVRDKQSAAGLAGLQAGDVIVGFNGTAIDGAVDLISKVAATPPDKIVNVEYLRESPTGIEKKSASLKLQERQTRSRPTDDENNSRKLPIDGIKADVKPFGLTLVENTPTVSATYKLEGLKGLLVKEVNPASYVADVKLSTGDAALGEGDLIQRINRMDVTDLKSFTEAVSKLKVGDAVVLHVISYDPRLRVPQLKIVQFTVK